jgi:hypothetical protein
LALHLPCDSFRAAPRRPDNCAATLHHLDANFIEGHTDSDPITPSARLRDNWDLSAARASTTYRILTAARPDLSGFLSNEPGSGQARQIFSVAGFADQRPVAAGNDEPSKEKNRRNDMRFVMAGPDKVPSMPDLTAQSRLLFGSVAFGELA